MCPFQSKSQEKAAIVTASLIHMVISVFELYSESFDDKIPEKT
jgi:hypothetical protein